MITITNTMDAAQYDIEKNEICVNQVPIPECAENDILIKNACASLCHSDLMLFWGHTAEKPPKPRITIGHENAGIVVALGKNVRGFQIGDKVGCLGCSYACYQCEGCQTHNLLCKEGTGKLHGFTTDGHFAEYSLSDYRNAMVLPKGMDMVTAAPLFCAGITAYHAINNCELKPGQWIAVIGCGGLGHLGLQYAKAMQLRTIAIDISEAQLDAARSLGADLVFNPKTQSNYCEMIKAETSDGAHAAVVFSAANSAYETAPNTLRANGLLMVVGIPPRNLSVNALDILLGKYRIKGSSSGVPQKMAEAINFSHKHNIKPHITTYDGLSHIQRIVDIMNEGKTAGRFGIVFNGFAETI